MSARRGPRRLIEAARLRTIARELVAVAPDAPWFLRAMVDGVSSLPADYEPRAEQRDEADGRRDKDEPRAADS